MKERAAPTVAIDGAKLRTLRESCMLSQAALGAAAGLNVASVNRLESGRRTMVYRSTIRKLAEALGVEPHELLIAGTQDG